MNNTESKKKVIVVGGGIAGLSAGIYALKAGFDAEIYEKNPVAGGECMGWNRQGYHIDNCIHWLTGTDSKTKLWEVWKICGAIDEKYMPKDLRKAYADSKAYPVTSGFQTAFAIDSDFSGEDTIFFECDPIKIGDRTFTRMSVKSYAYDKSFAPEGKTVLQANVVQTDADNLYWESLSKDEYKAKKDELSAEITKRIVKEFPELESRITLLDCWTPLTYNRYCNAYHGSYMGFVTTVGNKQMRFKGVVKGVNNLFIAGQWVMSPGGLPIAVVSGKFAVQRILKRDRRSIEI